MILPDHLKKTAMGNMCVVIVFYRCLSYHNLWRDHVRYLRGEYFNLYLTVRQLAKPGSKAMRASCNFGASVDSRNTLEKVGQH